MSPRYSQHVSRTSNLYPATCICQHICIRIQVARPGHMFLGDMSWCKRGVKMIKGVVFSCRRKGVSALHCAVTNGHVDMLRLLLKSGASANIRGQTYQRTPIFMAGEAGNEEMVSLLIHYGAKLNLTDQYGMNTTLLDSLHVGGFYLV